MDQNDLQNTTKKLIDNTTDETKHMADKTLRAASDALDQAGDRVASARTKAGDAIDQLSERAQHYARVGLDKAAETRDIARRRLQDASDTTSQYVEEQPLKSIAIAAGVGAATAALLMLLRGRDR